MLDHRLRQVYGLEQPSMQLMGWMDFWLFRCIHQINKEGEGSELCCTDAIS
jgi:hypothetical protein